MLAYKMGKIMHVSFLFVVKILSLMLLGYVFIFYHYVGWAIIYFLKVEGFVKLCAIGQHSKANTHL
jgi:hypothetical protein